MLLLSLLKCIEIVGEAASRVSPRTQADLPDLPWADIVGMRNRLIHAYYDVDHDLVWDTVEQDLPGLVGALQTALSDTQE
jgi:uncharacterized protein with HEPN domain